MPNPKKGESQADYVKRFMGSEEAKRDFPDEKQRLAVAHSKYREWKKSNSNQELILNYNVPIIESGILDNDFIIQGIAINATTTGNNHKFLVEELKESAGTLKGVPLLVDHKNEISAIKGRVITGEFDEPNTRINFKAKVVDNEIKQMIKNGLINSVSVGAAFREIEEQGDVLIPRGIVFKELSLVAVPADAGATFTTALQEAYKLKQDDEDDDGNPVEEEKVDEMEMEKCPECGKMIPKDKMKEHMANHKKEMEDKSSQSQEVISQSMKGGIKMSEEITENKQIVEAKTEVKDNSKELMIELQKIRDELNALKAKKDEVKETKVEVKQAKVEEEESDIKEIGKYKIVQGFGSIRGNSYTLVR